MINIVSNSPIYSVQEGKNDSKIINYDDPNIKDEECTYTFNTDGSASCVSNAWGTKTEFPKDTFIFDDKKVTAEEVVNEYKEYYDYCKKNNIKLMA